jgi:hypothetical protein
MTPSLEDETARDRIDLRNPAILLARLAWLGIQLILIYYCGSTGALFFYQGF